MSSSKRTVAGPNQPPRRNGRNSRPGGPPIPRVVANATPAPVVTFLDAFAKFKVSVPKKQLTLINTLSAKGMGIPLFYSNDSNGNSHPVGAAVRTYATACAYADMYKCGARSVLSICGVDRDRLILNKINSLADPAHRDLVMHVYRPLIVAKDIYRCHNNYLDCALPQVADGVDALFMLDVYDHMNGNLGPEEIMDYCRLYAGQRDTVSLWWVGFGFNKPYGVGFDDGAWKRNPVSGRITFFVDDAMGNSYQHSSMDWIWTNSTYSSPTGDHLSWTVVQHWAAKYYMIRFTYGIQPLYSDSPIIPPSGWTEVEVDEPVLHQNSVWMNSMFPITRAVVNYVPGVVVRWFFGRKKVMVPTDLYEMLKSQDFLKEKSRLSMQQMKTRAIEYMKMSADMHLLLKFFPQDFSIFIPNVVIAVFYENISYDAKISILRNDIYGEAVETMNSSYSGMGKKTPYESPLSNTFVAAAAGATVFYFAHKYNNFQRVPILGALWKGLCSLCSAPLRTLFSFLGSTSAVVQNAVPGNPLDVVSNFQEGMKGLEVSIVKNFEKLSLFDIALVAPLLEEGLKRIPIVGCLFGPLELCLKVSQGLPLLAGIPTVVMHEITRRMTYKNAVVTHALWNIGVFMIALQFKNALVPQMGGCLLGYYACKIMANHPAVHNLIQMYHSPNIFEWEVSEKHFSEKYPVELGIIPTVNGLVEKKKPICELMKVRNNLIEFSREPNTYWFLFLANPVPLRVPKRSDENLQLVVQHRVLVAAPTLPIVQKRRWKGLPDIVPIDDNPIIWEEEVHEWIEHFEEGPKRKRYRDAYELYNRYGHNYLDQGYKMTEVMVKTDEALCKMEIDGRVLLKPRCIANVHPSVQLDLGPVLYSVTKRFKNAWNPRNPYLIEFNDKKYMLAYAGAATDEDLSYWWKLATNVRSGEYYIMVSGDDSIIVTRDKLGLKIILGDFGMFDQSQSFGPLRYERSQLFRLGMSPGYLGRLQLMSSLPYRVNYKNGLSHSMIDRTQRPIRDTGGPDTSIGNSLVNAAAWITSLDKEHRQPIEDTMAYLGLDLKKKIVRDIEHADFLKGTWYRVNDDNWEFYWGPLPSRLLKVGKCLKDPRLLYKGSFEQAADAFLNDLACGYASYLQVPMLRCFVNNFYQHAKIRDLIENYKIAAAIGPKPLLHWSAVEQLAHRYGVDASDVLEFEETYPKEAFTFHSHKLYAAMARVDYS